MKQMRKQIVKIPTAKLPTMFLCCEFTFCSAVWFVEICKTGPHL